VYALATATAVLRGVRWIDHFYSLPGAYCLESEDREDVAPPGVLNALVETSLAAGSVVRIAAIAVGLGRGTAAEVGRLGNDSWMCSGPIPRCQFAMML
jgi:hypothetical protein